MNRGNPDRISILVDDELAAWELKGAIQALEQDAEMQACWRNYHLIGDAMRGNLPHHLCLDLNDRVTRALEHEPLYMQPRSHPPSTAANLTRTKTAVGFALAASLSAIAVIGVMDIGRTDNPTGNSGGAAMVASTPPPPAVTTVAEAPPRFMYTFTADVSSMPAGSVPVGGAARIDAAADAAMTADTSRVHTVAVSRGLPLANDLTDYLMNYQRYAAHHDNDDTLSYLRLVGYGAE